MFRAEGLRRENNKQGLDDWPYFPIMQPSSEVMFLYASN